MCLLNDVIIKSSIHLYTMLHTLYIDIISEHTLWVVFTPLRDMDAENDGCSVLVLVVAKASFFNWSSDVLVV